MPSSLVSALVVACVLAVAVFVISGLAEGRGRHLIRIMRNRGERRGMHIVYDDVQREEPAWDLLAGIDSEPEDESGRDRALSWARDAADEVKAAAFQARERAQSLRTPEPEPVTGEITAQRR